MGKVNKTTDFACEFGKRLNKIAANARHDSNNIMKMGISNPETNNGKVEIEAVWDYEIENKRRRARGGKSMPKEDCHIVCCNMKTPEVIKYQDAHCPKPEFCECWSQICDDVYATHGHGRPTEEGLAKFEELAEE